LAKYQNYKIKKILVNRRPIWKSGKHHNKSDVEEIYSEHIPWTPNLGAPKQGLRASMLGPGSVDSRACFQLIVFGTAMCRFSVAARCCLCCFGAQLQLTKRAAHDKRRTEAMDEERVHSTTSPPCRHVRSGTVACVQKGSKPRCENRGKQHSTKGRMSHREDTYRSHRQKYPQQNCFPT